MDFGRTQLNKDMLMFITVVTYFKVISEYCKHGNEGYSGVHN